MKNIKKYMNLVLKDILICKKMLFFILYVPMVLLFLPQNLWGANVIEMFSFLVICEMFIFISLYLVEEEKNKGTELLITTSYTRNDIVISRYLVCFLNLLVQIILFFLILFLVCGNFLLLNLNLFMINIFLICIMILILVPLSFKYRLTLFTVISMIFICPVMLLLSFMYKWNIDFVLNGLCVVLILGLIIISRMSIFISKKIYQKKDL